MTQIARVLVLCAAVVSAVTVASRGADAWLTTPELGLGYAIQGASNGDVLSAGESIGPDLLDFSVRLQSGLDGTDIWHYQLDGSAPDIPGSYNDYAGDAAFDPTGDVIAAGSTRNAGTARDVQVVKLGGANGLPIWTQVLDSPTHGNDDYRDMALNPSGDVAVAHILVSTPSAYTFSVARLAGATGSVLWSHDIAGNPRSRAAAVAFDGAGDVVAIGDIETTPFATDAVAAKLDGATGAELWRTVLNGGNPPGDDYGAAVAVDPAGDVFFAAQTANSGGDGFTVYKLAGATGALLWRYDHVSTGTTTSGFASSLFVDGAGDVYAGGAVDWNGLLVKLSGSSGAELWSRRYGKTLFGTPVPDLQGGLVLAGSRGFKLLVMKVSAADGRKVWRRTLRGNSYNGAYASAAAVNVDGNVVAAGAVVTPLPKGKVNGFPSYTVLKACGKNGRIRDTDACP